MKIPPLSPVTKLIGRKDSEALRDRLRANTLSEEDRIFILTMLWPIIEQTGRGRRRQPFVCKNWKAKEVARTYRELIDQGRTHEKAIALTAKRHAYSPRTIERHLAVARSARNRIVFVEPVDKE